MLLSMFDARDQSLQAEAPRQTTAAANLVRRIFSPPSLALVLLLTIWLVPDGLSVSGRFALSIVALAVIGWVLTDIDDTLIALAAMVAIAISGILPAKAIHATLGHELIWLLIAAFALAAIVKESGLLAHLPRTIGRSAITLQQLVYRLTTVIAATALIVPSTSARAAILLPVLTSLTGLLPTRSAAVALAILFPSIVLLSAGGSLIGAGAHIVAAEFIARTTGRTIGYVEWMALAGPFALASCFAAAWLIIRLFLSREDAAQLVRLEASSGTPLSPPQKLLLGIVLAIVPVTLLQPLHGVGMPIILMVALLAALLSSIATVNCKNALNAVDVELIVFLAATLVIADLLKATAADVWIAGGLLELLPAAVVRSTVAAVAVVAVVSALAHLVVISRTARATILIPLLAIPLSSAGHDPMLLIMVTVLATGFCQTVSASAKPVAMFARMDGPTFSPTDLVKLSSALLPLFVVGLIGYGLLFWRA